MSEEKNTSSNKDFVVLQPSEVDFSKLTFSAPRTNRYGKSVYLFYDKKKLYLRLPKMRSPYGAGSYQESEKYNIDLSVDEDDTSLRQMLESLDKKLKESGVEYSEKWFGEEKNEEFMEENYTSQLRKGCEFRVKLTKNRKNEFTMELYDKEQRQIKLINKRNAEEDGKEITEVLSKGVKVRAIVECVGLWFMKSGKFGVSWKAAQMKVYPETKKLSGYSFVDESDDEDESLAPDEN